MHSLSIQSAVAAFIVFIIAAGSGQARAGDALSAREVIPSDLDVPLSGTTDGMTVETGEINEAGNPAGSYDRSVWYEWTPSETGMALWSVDAVPWQYAVDLRGVAAYTIAGDGPVTMAGLTPAGAVVLPGTVKQRGMNLWVTANEKIILRVWTTRTTAISHEGIRFNLNLFFQPRSERSPGEMPSSAQPFSWTEDFSDGSSAVTNGLFLTRDIPLSIEAGDLSIGGKYYPDGAAHWLRWTADRAGAIRVSASGPAREWTTLIVAEMPVTGGPLSLVAGPGKNLTFPAVAGREYLIRQSMSMPSNEYDFAAVNVNLCAPEAGDEPAAAVPLAVGDTHRVTLFGASRSSVPPISAFDAYDPDVWLDLGSNLSGPHVLKLKDPLQAIIYKTDAAGNPVTDIAGRWGSMPNVSFLAVPGEHYLAKVTMSYTSGNSRGFVTLVAQTSPPPANDRRATAQLLPAEEPVLIRGDATNATAEESDSPSAGGRTVWYVLDRPASSQPWFVWAGNGTDYVPVSLFREVNGTLGRLNLGMSNQFTLTGSRIYIMAEVHIDPHFVLMTGPVVTPGDDLSDPIPLTAGESRTVFTGAATANSPLPDAAAPDPNVKTVWFSWTAQESGLVLFSTSGSMDTGDMRAAIYTASMERVPATQQVPDSAYTHHGEILAFQAVAGTSYRIALFGTMIRTSTVVLQPGGWDSPYDVWLLSKPAWKDLPLFTNPLADADGDGYPNLLAMACVRPLLLPEIEGYPVLRMMKNPLGIRAFFNENTWGLRGAEGSRPFTLTWESSTDGEVWTAAPTTVLPYSTEATRQHYWQWHAAPGENPGSRMFRLRVTR